MRPGNHFILTLLIIGLRSIHKSESRNQTFPSSNSNGTNEQAHQHDHHQVPQVSQSNGSPQGTQTPNNNTIIPPWFNEISLYDAAEIGDLEAVKYRLSLGDSATTADDISYHRGTPFHQAARRGHTDIVKYLVEEAGVPIDLKMQTEHDNYTALNLALTGCRLGVIKYLVEAGAELEGLRDEYDDPQIFDVQGFRCVQPFIYLLDKAPHLFCNATRRRGGSSLLHCAAQESSTSILRISALLKNCGASLLEAKDESGATPLHDAVVLSREDAVKYLVARGADVKTQNKDGNSLLHTAVLEGAGLPLVQFLVESAGVELTVRNGHNLTALEMIEAGSPVYEYLLKEVEKKNNSNSSGSGSESTSRI